MDSMNFGIVLSIPSVTYGRDQHGICMHAWGDNISYKAFNTHPHIHIFISPLFIFYVLYYYHEAVEMMTWIKIEGKLYIT